MIWRHGRPTNDSLPKKASARDQPDQDGIPRELTLAAALQFRGEP
jgi:hypothetical protein